MGPGRTDPAWEGFLLGFAAGDDPLWDELKSAVGPEHWTPAEAFAAAARARRGRLGRRAAGRQPARPRSRRASPSSAGRSARPRPQRQPTASRPACRPSPGPAPASSGSRRTRAASGDARSPDRARGTKPSPPRCCPPGPRPTPIRTAGVPPGRSGTWPMSAGLGTFGLTGGLITQKGQAVRFGSVVVKAVIPATPRPYSSPFAYCLHFSGDGCAECADRCPAGSVSVAGPRQGSLRPPSEAALPKSTSSASTASTATAAACARPAVPCESGIPEGLDPAARRLAGFRTVMLRRSGRVGTSPSAS